MSRHGADEQRQRPGLASASDHHHSPRASHPRQRYLQVGQRARRFSLSFATCSRYPLPAAPNHACSPHLTCPSCAAPGGAAPQPPAALQRWPEGARAVLHRAQRSSRCARRQLPAAHRATAGAVGAAGQPALRLQAAAARGGGQVALVAPCSHFLLRKPPHWREQGPVCTACGSVGSLPAPQPARLLHGSSQRRAGPLAGRLVHHSALEPQGCRLPHAAGAAPR